MSSDQTRTKISFIYKSVDGALLLEELQERDIEVSDKAKEVIENILPEHEVPVERGIAILSISVLLWGSTYGEITYKDLLQKVLDNKYKIIFPGLGLELLLNHQEILPEGEPVVLLTELFGAEKELLYVQRYGSGKYVVESLSVGSNDKVLDARFWGTKALVGV